MAEIFVALKAERGIQWTQDEAYNGEIHGLHLGLFAIVRVILSTATLASMGNISQNSPLMSPFARTATNHES